MGKLSSVLHEKLPSVPREVILVGNTRNIIAGATLYGAVRLESLGARDGTLIGTA